jgi:lysophospholipid acyltransferase (LPLAT)-like uncharacterized protein
MGSMTCTFSDGSQIEVGMFGYQSVVGISALMGTKKSLNRIYMQMPGSGYMVTVDTPKAESSASRSNLLPICLASPVSVSAIAAEFKKEGLIEYKRNDIYIPSTEALQKRACECYLVIKHHLENYAEFDTGFVV